MSRNILVGHEYNLSNILTLYKKNKLPNKILLSGKKGIGKFLMIKHFLYNIFDNQNSNYLIDKYNHPNVLNIKKKDDKKNLYNYIYCYSSCFMR